MANGIRRRHTDGCPGNAVADRCNCNAGWQAEAYDRHTGKKRRKSFAKKGEATSWRRDMMSALHSGVAEPATTIAITKVPTLKQAWEDWHADAKAGKIRSRSKKEFKPATLRRYDQAMRKTILPKWAAHRVSQVRHDALQDWADDLVAEVREDGTRRSASDIEVTMLPLRAIYKRLVKKKDNGVDHDPCLGLELPRNDSKRERIVPPAEAAALIAAIPKLSDRVIWATAFYAGLRRGELRALRRRNVDLAAGVIDVKKGWDTYEGEIDLKSDSGERKVPIVALLRDMLVEYLATKPDMKPDDRIFSGGRASTAFGADKLQQRADKVWEAAGLERATLHEGRHTFASIFIAAGVTAGKFNPKALSQFMGHSSIAVTYDRYGKLMPGAEEEAATLVNEYLDAQIREAEEVTRSADLALAGT